MSIAVSTGILSSSHSSKKIFTGRSAATGEQIELHLNYSVANTKTGAGYQTTILVSGTHPLDAIKNGQDESVCGNCPFRKQTDGTRACYVTPMGLGAAYKNRKAQINPDPLKIQKEAYIRLGSYGDPAMLPFPLVAALATRGNKHTGYTHQHGEGYYDKRFDGLLMRSVETLGQAKKAKEEGARYFRVDLEGIGPQEGEIECPYDSRGIQCRQCGLCNGVGLNGERVNVKSIMIRPHGNGFRLKSVAEKIKLRIIGEN